MTCWKCHKEMAEEEGGLPNTEKALQGRGLPMRGVPLREVFERVTVEAQERAKKEMGQLDDAIARLEQSLTRTYLAKDITFAVFSSIVSIQDQLTVMERKKRKCREKLDEFEEDSSDVREELKGHA